MIEACAKHQIVIKPIKYHLHQHDSIYKQIVTTDHIYLTDVSHIC